MGEVLSRVPRLVKLIAFFLFFGVLGLAGWFYREQNEHDGNKEPGKKSAEKIYVHILGEIKAPGLYRVDCGTRIGELADKAGGLTSRADLDRVNLAALLKDGQKIVIPCRENILKKIGVGKGPEENYINPPVEVEKIN